MEKEIKNQYGKELFFWEIHEYVKHDRNQEWYFLASIIGVALIVYSFFYDNFLFAAIVLISAFIVILHDSNEPEKIKFSITDEGIVLGDRFYDYDEFKNFAVVHKPNESISRLYFEFNNVFKYRLSIPIENNDPLLIQKNLLKYLSLNTERTNEPLSEQIGRLLKI